MGRVLTETCNASKPACQHLGEKNPQGQRHHTIDGRSDTNLQKHSKEPRKEDNKKQSVAKLRAGLQIDTPVAAACSVSVSVRHTGGKGGCQTHGSK